MVALPEFPPVTPSLGSSLVGQWLSFMSYGIMLCQALGYYQNYWKRDPWDLKVAVVSIIFGETVHTGLYAHLGYYYLVTSFGNGEAMSRSIISLTLVTPIVTICILCCQFIYVRRVYMILPPKFQIPFVVLVVIFIIDGLGFAGAFTGKLFLNGTFQEFLKYRWLLSGAFAPSAALDVFVSGVLSIALYKQRSGITRTDALVHTLILYAFTTGIVTSIMSIICLMVDLLEGNHIFIIPVALVTAKVYANSVLLTLNLRKSFQERLNETHHDGPTEWVGMSGIQTIRRGQGQPGGNPERPLRPAVSKLEFKVPSSAETDTFGSMV
ncbi:hypothetical protein C8Q76DRAFT_745789 [Earliella scabrosa]|nr:hypothetical protein C8Q76DRAFT_745789 [Earliella scabrosa]